MHTGNGQKMTYFQNLSPPRDLRDTQPKFRTVFFMIKQTKVLAYFFELGPQFCFNRFYIFLFDFEKLAPKRPLERYLRPKKTEKNFPKKKIETIFEKMAPDSV